MLQSQGSRAVDIKNAIQKQVGTCSSFCWESEGSFARKGEPCEKPRQKKTVFCWFVRCRSVFGAPLLLDVKGLQLHKILHKRFFLCIMRIDSKTLLKLSVYSDVCLYLYRIHLDLYCNIHIRYMNSITHVCKTEMTGRGNSWSILSTYWFRQYIETAHVDLWKPPKLLGFQRFLLVSPGDPIQGSLGHLYMIYMAISV